MTARIARVLAALFAALVWVAAPAQATDGTWGAGGYRYVSGTVCQTGNGTSPLASWDFGDSSLDFLTQAVYSDGAQDSARLPTQGTRRRSVRPVVPGTFGFGSRDEIAQYAALLSGFGSTQAAFVAKAVLDHTDPGNAPGCVDSSTAGALVQQAASAAGPYQLALTVPTSPVEPAAASPLAVQVTGVGGVPAAGVHVRLSASQAVLGGSDSVTVTTGPDGRAATTFVVPQGADAPGVDIRAEASVSVDLEAVTGPSGYAGAVFAGPPRTYSAAAAVAVSLMADPHIGVAPSSQAGTVNTPIPLKANVSGLRGHAGEAEVRVTGPVPLQGKTLCDKAASSQALAFDSPVTPVDGDGTVTAGSFTPTRPGCYWAQARVTTTDAAPQADAQSAETLITVLDTTSAFATRTNVLGPGPMSGELTIAASHDLAGTATVVLRGPATPPDGDCSGVDWSHLPSRPLISTDVSGDRTYRVSSERIDAAGCYQVGGSLALGLPSGVIAQVPIRMPSASVVYVLQPHVALTSDQTWAQTPDAVPAHVSVTGTYGQKGTVRVAMLRAPAGTFGCGNVDYAHAEQTGVGAPASFSGDGSYAVRSGATPRSGCYALVPELVLDANPKVTATGSVAAGGSTIVAGLPVDSIGFDGPPPVALEKPSPLSVWPTLVAYLAVAVGVMAAVLSIAAGARRPVRRPTPGIGLWD